MNLLLSISLLALLPCFFLRTESALPCNPRRFPEGIVCVCTEQYCDTQDPITQSPPGLVQIFESDRFENKRLEKRVQEFNGPENPGGQVWNVELHRDRVKQEILGFGGSFSDAAALTAGQLTPALMRSVYTSFFSENGLEFSMARVTISGSDFSIRSYSYDDTPEDIDLERWFLQSEDLIFKIPQMRIANEVAKHKVKYFGSSWAPPAWMKTNGMSNGNGTLRDGPGSVIWESYAKYLVKFLDSYKAAGLDFWGMTVQNEPMTGFAPNYPWNTCGFTAAMERDFVKFHLGPNLNAAGYDKSNFHLMVLDHDRSYILNWTETILPDPEANKYVDGVAVHWYGNDHVGVDVYDRIIEQYPDKFILSTEASMVFWEDPVGLGNWYLAETYMHDIADVTSHSVAGWVDWNLSLNMSGGPTWSAVSERSAPIIVNPEAGEFYKTPMFYALGHFSKFVPPGSKQVVLTSDRPLTSDFKVVSYARPDGGIAIVCVNSYDEPQVVALTDAVRGQIKLQVGGRSFNSFLYY